MLKKAVIYARYSSHSQTEQSIEGQLRVNYEYAKREELLVVGEYIDRAISGTSANTRPEFQRMINDSKKKQFDYVIVYKLDRFARNRYDSAVYKHKLKENGVKVLSATENISDNPEGIILEAVLEASAEYYSRELSQKVKRGIQESVAKGNFIGGYVPLGYKVIDKKVFINEDKANIVRYIFEQYANGTPKKEIVKQLNDKGYTTNTGKPFTKNSFQVILKNKKYIGIHEYKGIEYTNTYPAIIDKETFDRVQNKLKLYAYAPATLKAKDNLYVLYGKAFCGLCGAKLIGESGTSKTGAIHHYYSCSKKKNKRSCKKKNEKKDFLEKYIVQQTVSKVLSPKNLEIIANGVVSEYKKEFNTNKVDECKKQIVKLQNQIGKTFNLIFETDNKILIKKYENKIEQLENQKTDLEIDVAKLEIASEIQYSEDDIILWLKQFCKGDINDKIFRMRIIDTFINSVYVYEDKIVIYYNIKENNQFSFDTKSFLNNKKEHKTKSTTNNCDASVRISNTLAEHNNSNMNFYFIFLNNTFGCVFFRETNNS